ncbi:MAG: cupin domain-containing protein [Burkholderiaceae bacterium]|jgi:50S ribosomal protein L16 3-hydroxylase|nr:cupin domain-containing protein [Burkholderiaceae bacterium]
MRSTWQKRPRLLRQALPANLAPVDAATLFALASRDDVESRLVTAFGGRWSLRHGPLPARALPARTRAGWTLLVQGVDLYLPAAEALRERFRFISDARLDDVMVSYASDGGGVGPHVDSYDVFLLQAQGRRRWRISRQRDLALLPGLPLKILADFRAEAEWVLEPGDLLYLPPGVAHEGTALGPDCITCSIGFRAPAYRELVDPWLDALGESAHGRRGLQAQLRERVDAPTQHPARLSDALIDDAFAQLSRITPTRAQAEQALLALLSEPKPVVAFDAPARPLGRVAFARAAAARGLRLDARSRLLVGRGGRIGINGEVHTVSAAERAAIAGLADRRATPTARCAALAPTLLARLHGWYVAGWLHPG